MVVTEGALMNPSEASAVLKDKLRIVIAADVITRLAPVIGVGRQVTTFGGEPVGEIQFSLADLAYLAERLDRNPHLTDLAVEANDRLTDSRPAKADCMPVRGSFAYDGPITQDEEDE